MASLKEKMKAIRQSGLSTADLIYMIDAALVRGVL
jgi:hypothetical protein